MRWVLMMALVLAVSAQQARAEDPNPEQLKKVYDEAVVQLRAAQDRINNLAMENEKLTAKVTEMQKQLDAATANEASFADRTYQWRATNAAWEQFLKRYPSLLGKWQAFLQSDVLNAGSLPDWSDDAGANVAISGK